MDMTDDDFMRHSTLFYFDTDKPQRGYSVNSSANECVCDIFIPNHKTAHVASILKYFQLSNSTLTLHPFFSTAHGALSKEYEAILLW